MSAASWGISVAGTKVECQEQMQLTKNQPQTMAQDGVAELPAAQQTGQQAAQAFLQALIDAAPDNAFLTLYIGGSLDEAGLGACSASCTIVTDRRKPRG